MQTTPLCFGMQTPGGYQKNGLRTGTECKEMCTSKLEVENSVINQGVTSAC